MTQVVYSFADKSDERDIRELLKRCELPDEDIALHIPQFVLARTAGLLVGCVGLEIAGSNALLRSLAVVEEYRVNGIGKELCRQITDHARSRGYERIYLLTTADRYFRKLGFEPIARDLAPEGIKQTEQFRTLCPSSAVLMTSRL